MKNQEDAQQIVQAILDNADIYIYAQDYDFTQPDSMDESGSEGLWDLAGAITIEFGERLRDADRDKLQTLLYNLLGNYRCAEDDDD